MQKMTFCIILLLILMEGSAQRDQQSDLEQLKLLNAKFISNFVNEDSAAHSRILHEGFVCITSDGDYINRKEYLKWWAHGFSGYKYWDYRDERITIFGNLALVRAKNKYVILRDGRQVEGMSMYSDTYLKENGNWKCVQAQITRVSPDNYPADETIVRKWDLRK